jgi:thiol-disulfide isomerase/thioredoxin
MRRIGLTLVSILCAGAAALPLVASKGLALAPGNPAPLLVGVALGDTEMQGLDWSAKRYTLVNFWATWCVPCQEEMPALQKMHERYADDGLAIVGVHRQVDVTDREIADFTSTFGVTYTIVRAAPRVGRDWGGLTALPASFIVDGEGRIVRRYIGATPEQVAGMEADVDALMAGRPLPLQVLPEVPRTATAPPRPTEDE